MKISKVNHSRTGIGVENSKSKGIIYYTPKLPDSRNNIKEYIETLVKASKKLYSPFNSECILYKQYVTVSKKDYENYKKKIAQVRGAEKQIKINCKNFIVGLARNNKYSSENFKQNLRVQSINKKYDFLNEMFCKDIVNVCLRKSLKKVVNEDGNRYFIKDIMLKIVKTIAGVSYDQGITEEEQRILYNVVIEDYHKKIQIKKLVRSIENKDTKVQVFDVNTEKRLELSSFSNPKKKYISDFIHDYVSCDDSEKRKLLSHMRSILLLYICGADKYNLSKNEDLLSDSWGGFLPEDNEEIIDMIRDSMNEDDKYNIKKYKCYYEKIRMEHYGKAIRVEGISNNDKMWIGYFNDEVGKLFKRRTDSNENIIIGSKYIIKLLWKNWVSYIAMKYIDIGKAVYHFAMPEIYHENENIQCGVIREPYINGISSFDYERIKAKENIARELAVYTTFASNIFGRATVNAEYFEKNGNEDVLSITDKQYNGALKNNVKRNILQYFGGKSSWENTDVNNIDDHTLFKSILKAMKDLRNTNYHYSSKRTNENNLDDVIVKLFNVEKNRVATILRKKYYANNTLMFYSKENIDALMCSIYDKKSKREAQVPSFGNVCKKSDCKLFVGNFVNSKSMSNIYEGMEQFYSSFYFLLKEIYYYDFLQCDDIKERFLKALNNETSCNKEAKDDFCKYIKEYCKDKSFGQLCQTVMTEYNQQNQNIKEVRTRENRDKEIYKHFRMLLYITLRAAFETYVMDKYAFMNSPRYEPDFSKKISEKDFCNGFSVKMYDNESLTDEGVASMYIMSHFITSNQLNHLQGAIKDYLQFIDNIDSRAYSTCNNRNNNNEERKFYEMVQGVIDIVMLQNGQVSHCFEDYFDSENEYAAFLLNYVEYASKDDKNVKDGKYTQALKAYCSDNIVSDQKIGIYYDELNPIVNKNIIHAKLFGFESKVSKLIKVRRNDINKYYELKNSLVSAFKNKKCNNAEEQKNIKAFQDVKNMVELYDVTTYTEIMIDCVAQLVSYAYLRERDNMYFQLGYHYMHLFYGKEHLMEGEEQLLNIEKGAILHQIYAIYDYNAPIVKKKGAVYEWDSSGQIGAKIRMFLKCYSNEKYLEGMYFFENINMHDILSDRRKYIAHMKYMSKEDNSILDMYTWMYNGFFDYDIKLKKSMSFVLKNILMKYFVKLDLKTEKEKCAYEVAKSQYINTKETKEINVTETRFKVKSIFAEKFVYKDFKVKIKKGNREINSLLEIDARNKTFCVNVKSLLEMRIDS